MFIQIGTAGDEVKANLNVCRQCKSFRNWNLGRFIRTNICVLPTKTLPSRATVKLDEDDIPERCIYKLEQLVMK